MSTSLAHRYHPRADEHTLSSEACAVSRPPFSHFRLTVQPLERRTTTQLWAAYKPTGARSDYRGRWCAVNREGQRSSRAAYRQARRHPARLQESLDTGVGKSSIVCRFVQDHFDHNICPTIGASFLTKTVPCRNELHKFLIWDTAGQERDSFVTLKKWVKELKEHGPEDIVVAIAGNKSDLGDIREVPVKEAKEYAESIAAIFVETSARNAVNVEELFQKITPHLETKHTVATLLSEVEARQHQTFPANKNGFKVGMRLEGIDPLHPSMLCVLSVAEVLGYRIRLHFDGFSECYDFWANADSPDIHPVGWCTMTGHKLQPPKAYTEDGFDWESYLTACNVQAAPKNLFKNQNTTVTPSGFQVGLKLEAVDRKNPSLVCVASIADIVGNRFLVHFDNWDDTYDYWCNASSPHIHPVGWCQDNGRPLTAPQGPADLKTTSSQGVCPTPGCRGVGHIKGARHTGHHSAFGCPYSEINMKKEMILPDRLGGEKQITFIPVHLAPKTKRLYSPDADEKPEEYNMYSRSPVSGYDGLGHLRGRLAQSATYLKIKEEKEEDEEEDEIDLHRLFRGYSVDNMQQALHQSVFLSAMSAQPNRDLPLCWEQHCKLLPGVARVQASRVAHWTADEQIDGKAFLLLSQVDIVKIMSVKLGPALKIYNSILMFKNAEDMSKDTESGNIELDT
ncbi:UNVERIFIED_CONTAM: hypothetical protein FKN15_032839 [Acipenser sinensis]